MNKFKKGFTSFLKGRNFSSAVLTAIVLALVVFVNIIIYTLSTVFPLYLHSPERDDLSITSASDTLFYEPKMAGHSVTVTFCSYEDVVAGHDTGAFVLDTAKQFAERHPGFINLRFINVFTKLDSEGNSVAEELEKYQSDESVVINGTSVIFSTETNYRVLTDNYTGVGYVDFYTLNEAMAVTSYNGEEIFASSVMWVLRDGIEKAYFTTGHGETANMTMKTVLNSAGYDIQQIDLRKQDVPEDAALLVISNPFADFERGAEGSSLITEYDRLKSYAERGGNFYVIMNYYSKKLPVLESFIAEFGIKYRESESGSKLVVKDSRNAITTDGFTLVSDYAGNELADSMKQTIVDLTDGDGNVIMREVVALELSGEAQPVLISSPTAVLQADGGTVDSSGSYTVAACSEKKNDSAENAKMFFMFDGNVTATDAIVTDGYSNKDFLYSLFDVFFGKDDMPYGCRSVVYNEQRLENLTMGTARIYAAALIAIPVLLAVLGSVVMIRRKNR